MDFAIPADHRMKIKERENIGLRLGAKKTEENRETVIPIVTGTLGTVFKGLERGLEELKIVRRIEIIQTTH